MVWSIGLQEMYACPCQGPREFGAHGQSAMVMAATCKHPSLGPSSCSTQLSQAPRQVSELLTNNKGGRGSHSWKNLVRVRVHLARVLHLNVCAQPKLGPCSTKGLLSQRSARQRCGKVPASRPYVVCAPPADTALEPSRLAELARPSPAPLASPT